VDKDNIQLLRTIGIVDKSKEKVGFKLLGKAIPIMGKIVKKQGFEYLKRGNYYSFLLRLVEPSAIEKNNRTLEILETEKEQINANEQVIRFEEGLINTTEHADLPF
jgi:hypothetical protein